MHRLAQSLAVVSLMLVLGLTGRAGDKSDAEAIISKAVKAHFPKGVDTKNKGLRMKNKGTLHIMGLDLPFTQDVSVQDSSKFKEVMELNVMGKNIVVSTVFNGKEGWILADGKDVKVTDEILNELKEATYTMGLMQGVFVKDKGVKYSVVGEVQVKGKPAIGLTVSREGKKDVNMFFDKKTGLVTKVEMRKRDLMSGQEMTEERIITEYQDVSDRKVAKKVEVIRDGKQFLEVEVLEVQILEKVDDGEFVQPK
jgi:hypothetical protein